MAKFLATRQIIFSEEVIIEAKNEKAAQKILDKNKTELGWDNRQFLDTDYYEIVEEITEI